MERIGDSPLLEHLIFAAAWTLQVVYWRLFGLMRWLKWSNDTYYNRALDSQEKLLAVQQQCCCRCAKKILIDAKAPTFHEYCGGGS